MRRVHSRWLCNPLETAQRFEAWWRFEPTERPIVQIGVETGPLPYLPSHHGSLRERWMDVEFQVQNAVVGVEGGIHLADSFPQWLPNLGPDLLSTLFGGEIEFGEDTSWVDRPVRSAEDWERFCATDPNLENPYIRTIDAMTDRALRLMPPGTVIGVPDLHGNYDILSGLRGPEELCMDMLDEPALVLRAASHAARGFNLGFTHFNDRLRAAGQPSVSWLKYHHPGPAYVTSCDFWCMVSPEAAREMVLPSIREEMRLLERSVFHLDGPSALRHLDLLLELPDLQAVQWVFGAGNGPAARWIPVYQKIRDSGRGFVVHADDPEDAFAVLDAVGPRGLWLMMSRWLPDVPSAERFLEEVVRRSAGK